LKVAPFNINNINKRLDNLLAWLVKAEPDVVSLRAGASPASIFLPWHDIGCPQLSFRSKAGRPQTAKVGQPHLYRPRHSRDFLFEADVSSRLPIT